MNVPRGGCRLRLAALIFLLGPGLRPATAQLLGPEFQVNSYTTSYQILAAVTADGSGNFVVVWGSDGQDGSGVGVFGQRYDSAGSEAGGEFQVNSWTTGYQGGPAVAADEAGNFVVVWFSDGQDASGDGVFGQRFNSAGGLVEGEFRINTYTTGDQRFPAVAADDSGDFVVVWHSDANQDGSFDGVFAQRYSSTGSLVGSEFRVNTYTTNDQRFPAVAADGSGNFVVVWASDGNDGSGFGVFGKRYNSEGSSVGPEFQVNSYMTGDQRSPAVAVDGSGDFVVTWRSGDQDGSEYGVFGQRYDSAGILQGSEFRVNTYTTGYQWYPTVAANGSGNFVVVWNSDQDGSFNGVFGQWFDSTGRAVGNEFQINSYTTGFQNFPVIATGGSDSFVVAWHSEGQDLDNDGVIGRRLNNSLFADDFETSDVCNWSTNLGGGDC